MNGENTNILENNNQKNQNKPQIDPFLVVSSYNEQFINQYKAFKLGQVRFTELAKKEREILATEGISLIQSLQAKVMFFRARELAINYLNRLDEVEAKLEFTKKVLGLVKNKKCKIVGSTLVIDEIITDENNNTVAPVSIDIDEINQLIGNTDLDNLSKVGSIPKTNLDNNSKSLQQNSTTTESQTVEDKPVIKEETNNINKLQQNSEDTNPKPLTTNEQSYDEQGSVPNIFASSGLAHSSIVTTRKKVDTPTENNDEGFDEIASRILNSLNKDNSSEKQNDIEVETDVNVPKSDIKPEVKNDEIDESDKATKPQTEDHSDDYPFEKSETSLGDVDSIDGSELEVVKVYKCNNDCIDLLEPENAELVYGLYSDELFNETFNKLLDVIYCYPLSIVTLPDVAIDELKCNETMVCVNGIKQTITTFEYLVRFCACVIMRNQKSDNFKHMVQEFYTWCQKVGM